MKKKGLVLAVLLSLGTLPVFAQYALGIQGGICPSFNAQDFVCEAGVTSCIDITAQTFVPSLTAGITQTGVQYLTVSLDYWLTNQRIAQSLFRWYAGAGSCLSVSLRNNPGLCTVGLRAVIGTEFFPVTQMGIFLQAIAQPQFTFGSELRFSFCIPVEAGVRFWF